MIERLYYLFYKVVSSKKENNQSFFKAYIGFCFLEYMNLGSIFGIVNHYVKYSIPEKGPLYGTVFIFGGIMLYNYFNLWIKQKHIVSKYENLPNKNGAFLIWAIIIFSFSLFYVVLEYGVERSFNQA